jgi:restriction system protein
MTITEAIKQVMRVKGMPMTADEAYRAIAIAKLYEFHSDHPRHIVRSQIRRHCEGLDFPSAASTKIFRLVGDNSYELLEEVKLRPRKVRSSKAEQISTAQKLSHAIKLRDLQLLHMKYVAELKRKILADLKRMSPAAFELFAKRLLDVYGFHDTKVTQLSGDGGIDGFGKLKVGLANLSVAFQCKRWTKGNIQRPEIDKFRGAVQGEVEQGLFFTTASFSEGAIAASIKRGAVPIILVDGESIVDLMIEKGFGVQVETMFIPSYALDLVLGNDESAPIRE